MLLNILAQATQPVVNAVANGEPALVPASSSQGIMIGAGIAVAGAGRGIGNIGPAALSKPSPASRKPRVRSAHEHDYFRRPEFRSASLSSLWSSG